MTKMKKPKKGQTLWVKGNLWGYVEKGELTLSLESKLWLTKENNRRSVEEEIRRLLNV